MSSFGDELKTSVSYDVRKVILGVVKPMELLNTIIVESVVVELTILNQPIPLIPPRWNMMAIILVQIFSKVCRIVSTLLEVGCKGPLLMIINPECGAAIVVVGEDVMIVDIQAWKVQVNKIDFIFEKLKSKVY